MQTRFDSNPPGPAPRQRSLLRTVVLGVALAGAIAVWFFREPLRNRITERATLANDAPPPEVVEDMIQNARDPVAAVVTAWNSGKIVHREVAVREIGRVSRPGRPLPAGLESIVLAGALDADMNVRESALGILRDQNHSALAALAGTQLQDCDPQTRVLGLNHLKRVNARIGVPVVIPLLDEDEPFIVSMGL